MISLGIKLFGVIFACGIIETESSIQQDMNKSLPYILVKWI